MMKKSWMTMLLLLCAPSALALVSVFTLPGDTNVTVTVESTVTELNPGEFLYTYQITDIGDLNISLFAVPFSTALGSSEIRSFEDSGASVSPFYWDVIGSPAVAAQAFFAPVPLTDSGSSLILSFESIYDAEEVDGYVNDAQLGSLYGTLLAPVPEPVTISLLAIGAGIIVRKKHKKKISNTESRRAV